MASMVVIFFPATAATGVTHERIGCPSRCTVHAPHSAIPQPNFVPVSPTTSRSTHRIGMSDGTSTVTSRPLIFNVVMNHALRERAAPLDRGFTRPIEAVDPPPNGPDVLHRSNLDAAGLDPGELRRDADRLVHVLGLDQVEAREQLLGLGERSIDDGPPPVADAHLFGGRRA